MKRYRITYRDLDPCCPLFTMHVKAWDREHALMKFQDADPDDDGWLVISIERV